MCNIRAIAKGRGQVNYRILKLMCVVSKCATTQYTIASFYSTHAFTCNNNGSPLLEHRTDSTTWQEYNICFITLTAGGISESR